MARVRVRVRVRVNSRITVILQCASHTLIPLCQVRMHIVLCVVA
jgi:hypothetical protein